VQVVRTTKRAKTERRDGVADGKAIVKFSEFSKIDDKRDGHKFSPAFDYGGLEWKLNLIFGINEDESDETADAPGDHQFGMELCLDDKPWLLGEDYNSATQLPSPASSTAEQPTIICIV